MIAEGGLHYSCQKHLASNNNEFHEQANNPKITFTKELLIKINHWSFLDKIPFQNN